MKKISTLLFIAALTFFGCSSDDDNNVNNNCDCNKISLVWNESMQAYEPTGSEFYSNNCNDDTGQAVYGSAETGFYEINCTPKAK